jgi:hypothetical protein
LVFVRLLSQGQEWPQPEGFDDGDRWELGPGRDRFELTVDDDEPSEEPEESDDDIILEPLPDEDDPSSNWVPWPSYEPSEDDLADLDAWLQEVDRRQFVEAHAIADMIEAIEDERRRDVLPAGRWD